MEKYYKARQSAEAAASGIVHLTEEEYRAVQKFLSQVYEFSRVEVYCGSCGIDETAFDTEEEAEASLYWEENNDDEDDYISQDKLSAQWNAMGRSE